MLKRDDELRLSTATQRAYAKSGDDGEMKTRTTEKVQRRVAREFGFSGTPSAVQEGLEVMRSAGAMFPNDEEVAAAAHYMRHNIHVPCPIPIGDVVPDIPFHTGAGGQQSLHDLTRGFPGRTLLVAGSGT